MKSLADRLASTPLFGGNAPYVEALYESFLEDPASVPEAWRRYFQKEGRSGDTPRRKLEAEMAAMAKEHRPSTAAAATGDGRQAAAQRLLDAYRMQGHLRARLDPLELTSPAHVSELVPEAYGLAGDILDQAVETDWAGRRTSIPLNRLIERCRRVFCGTLAAEYGYIEDSEERRWMAEQIEGADGRHVISDEDQKTILAELVAADGLEKYLHRRYVGQKRFSLEGGDSLIPMIEDVVRRAGERGVKEIVIGMAHRGRLNVLVNILGKSPKELFSEFEGSYDPKVQAGSGDVKYHLGFSSDVNTPGGPMHLALAFNPSHLEAVDPVVLGSVRARQDRGDDIRGDRVLPVLVHGDASLAGQGVVMETLQMAQTRGFSAGGTVHVVVNNQIGFTISNNQDARSSRYCTDIAKMLEAPVLHANGDDPEACVFAMRVALEYRQKFHRDIFVDLVCYRRHGHNEADEPAVTQPEMYAVIRKHPTPREVYARRLIERGIISENDAKNLVDAFRKGLDEGKVIERATLDHSVSDFSHTDWTPFIGRQWSESAATGVPMDQLTQLGAAIAQVPDEFHLHSRTKRILDERRKMVAGDSPLDWGFAENLAYATLVAQGYPVRMSGQDSGRGTFFHRHAILYDTENGQPYVPLNHLREGQAPFMIYDSLLSESAVVGFEYGYSTTRPNTLVLWEAQYGDFANNAQVMVDQFISSGSAKWGRLCGLVLLLPHGYEGAGPEHSSARLERYLQLCAQHNMQVCMPTTPAQMFHMLRRQLIRQFRAPLVVMTPKSLLRHKQAVSSLEELADGEFHALLPDEEMADPKAVNRVVFCSGKVYYELLQKRAEAELADTALIRIEQLYPFPVQDYAAELKRYSRARDIVWCQEEPLNQGAWYQIRHRLQQPLTARQRLRYAGRSASPAPATGYARLHRQEQQALVEEALGIAEKTETQSNVKRMETS